MKPNSMSPLHSQAHSILAKLSEGRVSTDQDIKTALDAYMSSVSEWNTEQALYQGFRDAVPAREGELEVDDNAPVSYSDDPGAYVQAWVWVDDFDAGWNREAEEADDDNQEGDVGAIEDLYRAVCDCDADAVVSLSEDGGAYVQTWSWVSDAEAGVSPARRVAALQ